MCGLAQTTFLSLQCVLVSIANFVVDIIQRKHYNVVNQMGFVNC